MKPPLSARTKRLIHGSLFLVFVVMLLIGFLPQIYINIVEGAPFDLLRRSGSADTALVSLLTITGLQSLALWQYRRWALRENVFGTRFRVDRRVAMILGVMVAVLILSLVIPHASNFVEHYTYRVRLYGDMWGLILTVIQYFYYVVEGVYMVWMLDSFQSLGESTVGGISVPWGGIGLACTWGLLHLFTKGPLLFVTHSALALLSGILFLIGKRNFWPPFVLWMEGVVL